MLDLNVALTSAPLVWIKSTDPPNCLNKDLIITIPNELLFFAVLASKPGPLSLHTN